MGVQMRISVLLALASLFAVSSRADLITLEGSPPDWPYLDDVAICIDVAAANLMASLGLGGENMAEDQKAFHKKWDPDMSKKDGGMAHLVEGLEKSLGAGYWVQRFYTKDLSYVRLLAEWNAGERIILMMQETKKKFGHAVFLWGLENDANKPKVSVTDPNVHPNIGEGKDQQGKPTEANVTIGKDSEGRPEWLTEYTSPEYTYDQEVFDKEDFHYRITAFVSVSPVPEPCTALLSLGGFLVLVIRAHVRRVLR